jgi:zinc protease
VKLERTERDVHVFRTARNVPVLVLARPGTPMVNLGVFLRAGAVSEPAALAGVARLAAQAALKQTRTRGGAEIALAAESLGGSIAVGAGLESIGWSMSVPVRHFERALELLADVIQEPVFSDAAVDTEAQLALAEVHRLRDDMYRWPMRLASRAAYGEHPYARSVLGEEDALRAITATDVRAQHARALQHGACVIGVVGDVNAHEAAQHVQSRFASLAWGDDLLLAPSPWPDAAITYDDTRDKRQTALAMLFEGPARGDADRHAGQVLAAVASGLGGRFFEELRDKLSLAYTVAAYPIERRVSGAFAAYIATAPHREDEARDGLLREFARLRESPVREEEIERARRYLIGAHAIAQQSGGAVLANMIDAWSFGDGLHELGEYTDRIAAVTVGDLQALAQRYFDPARRVEGVVRGTAGEK